MKGIDNIIKEILMVLGGDCTATKEQTKSQIDDIMSKAKADVDKQIDKINGETDAKCKELSRREKTILDVELRRNKLLVKRQLVDEAFEMAYGELCALDKKAYDGLCLKMLTEAVSTGSEQVVAGTDNKIDKALLDKANKELKAKGKDANLTLADELVILLVGFVLRDKGIETNCTFKMLVSQLKPQLENQVAKLIFPN